MDKNSTSTPINADGGNGAVSPVKISLIKTPFAKKDGGISNDFDIKSQGMISGVKSSVFGVHNPNAVSNDIAASSKGVDFEKQDSISSVSNPNDRDDLSHEDIMRSPSRPTENGPGYIFGKPVRDKNVIRQEISDVDVEIEHMTAKKKSLQSESLALTERKKEISARKTDLEKREQELEQKEADIENKITESLSFEEKKTLEDQRWELEQERENIEKERWEYDQGIIQMSDDLKALGDEMLSSNALIEKTNKKREQLLFEFRALESAEKKVAVDAKIKEVENLREQVIIKQKELRDKERELFDAEQREMAKVRSLIAQIKEIEVKEHEITEPQKRHEFEQGRWKLEKERKATQDLVWGIQAEKKRVEDQRISWTSRDEKFAEAIKTLKNELLTLKN